MARRLLGADNAATVLNTQDTEEEPVTQVRWLRTPGEGSNMPAPAVLLTLIPPWRVLMWMSVLRFSAGVIPMTAGFPFL